MTIETQSVEKTVSAMAKVLEKYLNHEEVLLLTVQWRQYPTVSIKMMQQCVLEATKRYPKLKPYRSDIRKDFWGTMQAASHQSTEAATEANTVNGQKSEFEGVQAFYTVMEAFNNQLTAPDNRSLFQTLHQAVSKERTFKGHTLNISQFLDGGRPVVPHDMYILNNVLQLAYVCLCNIVGPVEADDILFQVAEIAKQSHPKAVVEKLF
ncbi:hypothetical protein [Psychrobacter sp. N25K4-3-2]|uniref:hypothetical protein n=1 Tax=unclassified Psychrobacter TaxID=196806 RepID=UPI00188BD16A|nr:hypothetical protein [Psychrobacter sp. N25K4-3-2]MBF4490297.1 hypothetical protein [Psychrobacter sp. N25K4-3-2]